MGAVHRISRLFHEPGFRHGGVRICRAKNTVNILSKNFIVFAIASVSFWLIGWGLMFGNGNPFMGLKGLFFVGGVDNSPAIGDAYKGVYAAINWTGVPLWAKFFFQLVFAGTAATIVPVPWRNASSFILFIFLHPGGDYLSGHRPLDLGRRLPGGAGHF